MIIKASTSVRVYKQNKSRQTIFELSGVSKIHISIKNFRNALDEKLLIKKKFRFIFPLVRPLLRNTLSSKFSACKLHLGMTNRIHCPEWVSSTKLHFAKVTNSRGRILMKKRVWFRRTTPHCVRRMGWGYGGGRGRFMLMQLNSFCQSCSTVFT